MTKFSLSSLIIFTAIVLSSSFAAAQSGDNPSVYTLKKLYSAALENSERIAISEDAVRTAEGLYREALGGAFPEISYRRVVTMDDDDSSHDGMFRLTQSGLTGYRELSAIRSGRSFLKQREYEHQRVEQLLLQDIAEAFYALLLAEENVTATQKLTALAEERLKELQERARIGRTREADSLAQEFLVASLESQEEDSLRQVGARRDLLAFLINTPELKDDVVDVSVPTDIHPLEFYLAFAKNRPDVQAVQADADSARALSAVARSEYWPDLNVTANAYTDRSDSDEDWDVALAVNVPLWNWGGRRGTLNAAKAVLDQTEKNLRLVQRQAELDIRNAFRDYDSAKKQRIISEKAVELARRNYEMQIRDDEQGLVTSLEVFESLDRLNKAELTFNNARLEEKLSAIHLAVSAGQKPDEILP